MADFPTGIRCSSIVWLPGSQPLVDQRTDAGNYRPVAGVNRSAPCRIRVAFTNITRANFQIIRNHAMAEGNTGSWLLSPQLLDIDDPVPTWSSKRWRYLTIPQALDTTLDVHSIEFEIEEVPALLWIDRIVMRAKPGNLEAGSTVTMIGPDTLPTIWSSRLTTTNNVTSGAYRSWGNIAVDESDGSSYQAFWFAPTGSTFSRVVVVKRTDSGVILWQRWTTSGIDAVNAGVDSYPPAVAVLSGGGCVVAARRSTNTSAASSTHAWCLESNGATRWQRQYTLAISGPAQLWHNASTGEIIMGTTARNTSFPTQLVPTLVRLSATNGDFINAHRYTVDSAETEFRRMAVLGDGSLLFLCRPTNWSSSASVRSYLVKLTSAFAVSTVSAYGSSSTTGPTTFDSELIVLSDGGLLLGTRGSTISGTANTVGLLRVSATYGVLNHYAYTRTGGGFLTGLDHVTAGFDASGNGWLVTRNTVTFGSNSVTILATNTEATGLDYLTEAETELDPNTQTPSYGSNRYQVDPSRQRLVVHASGGFDSSYSCIAEGWALRQPTSTLALDIGGGRNLQGLTTDPAPGSVGSGPTVTRTIVSAAATTLTGTASTATLTMADAASSLSWSYSRVIA
jgi:hypothetical protein